MGIIDIYNIKAGWAVLQIGDCTFNVSYLCDLKSELDELFCFHQDKFDIQVNKIILDGESQGNLSLIAHLTFEDVNQYLSTNQYHKENDKYDYVLNIVWQNIFGRSKGFALIKYPYKEFMCEYYELTKRIKNEYIVNFTCPYDDEEYKNALDNY